MDNIANPAELQTHNVLHYGALGPKATSAVENARLIQKAIDAANEAGGGLVYFPAATYSVAPPSEHPDYCFQVTSDHVWLVGDGPESVLANSSQTGETIRYGDDSAQPRLLMSDCGVRDLSFVSPGPDKPSVFRDCRLTGGSDLPAAASRQGVQKPMAEEGDDPAEPASDNPIIIPFA